VTKPPHSPAVQRALVAQRKAAKALSDHMAKLAERHPEILEEEDPHRIAARYPRLLVLMERAARADAHFVMASRQHVAGATGVKLPQAPPTPAIDWTTARCEGCGCGWLTACQTDAGPCSWDADYAAVDRAGCSNCITLGKLPASPL
jgi:hypothetical protein